MIMILHNYNGEMMLSGLTTSGVSLKRALKMQFIGPISNTIFQKNIYFTRNQWFRIIKHLKQVNTLLINQSCRHYLCISFILSRASQFLASILVIHPCCIFELLQGRTKQSHQPHQCFSGSMLFFPGQYHVHHYSFCPSVHIQYSIILNIFLNQ